MPPAATRVRLGLVGCGNRGSGACRDALSTRAAGATGGHGRSVCQPPGNQPQESAKVRRTSPPIDVPPERRFVGFDAYQKVIDSDVDLVLFATPPHFRPIHYAAAVKAGKHVFLEKPCCVDAPGYRSCWRPTRLPRRNACRSWWDCNAAISRCIWRRSKRSATARSAGYGSCGPISICPAARAGGPKPPEMSEMEYQIRYWNLFCWLCGDHLVEQACHVIDVANWVMDAHPVRANGMGARQIRTGPGTGDIYDRHIIEFEYADGTRHYCQARQQPGTWSQVSENVHGYPRAR